MMHRQLTRTLVVIAGAASSVFAQSQGPSTLQTPYMLPSDPASGTVFYSVASNGNGVLTPDETFTRLNGAAPYRLVGIPDGLGVIRTPQDIKNGTLTLTCNHELGNTTGIIRDHGNRGSFVSTWTINITPGPNFLRVIGAQDMIQTVKLFNNVLNVWETYNAGTGGMPLYSGSSSWNGAGVPNANPNKDGINRLCSADVPAASAFRFGTLGTDARMHLAGEESGANGRAFATLITGPEAGTTYQLASYGNYSWENVLACPFPQAKTIAIGMEDGTPGNVYVHIGTKQSTGTDIERAGLTSAHCWGIKIAGTTINGTGQAVESQVNILGNAVSGPVSSKPFTMVDLGDLTNVTGAQLQTQTDAQGIINFNRPEDGAWDTRSNNKFYFVTTDSIAGNSRLWELAFTDITQPELGGVVSMLGDGSVQSTWSGGFTSASGATDIRMMDNIGVTKSGQILIQEDVGNNVRLGRAWLYTPWTDSVVEVGIPDANRFLTGGGAFLTQDEETSGVVSAEEFMGSGWFFQVMQAHYGISGELAEGGQLMAIYIPATQVGAACYANCDGSTVGPVLTANDFQCFLNAFSAGSSYANCDGSTVSPVLTANDFQCFLNAYSNGCQ